MFILFTISAMLWLALVLLFWRANAWLPYFVLATTGFSLLFVVASREFLPIEAGLRTATALAVHHATKLAGIETQIIPGDPGSLVVNGGSEWTRLSIGLESSGLLETAALAGLVVFFPANSLRQRGLVLAAAVLATFAANTLRVSLIVASVAWIGQPVLDVTHLVLGRIVFFVLAICIYWFVVTRPTLRAVQARIEASS